MIHEVTIKNYKSVVDVSLPLGRFNLLIGANGCGKSNILEGIALGAAASADKLDFEYFANRGIRVTETQFMLPAFDDIYAEKIVIGLTNSDNSKATFDLRFNRDLKPAQWQDNSVNADSFVTYVGDNPAKHGTGVKEMIDLINKRKSDNDKANNLRLKTADGEVRIMAVDKNLNRFLIYSLEESKLRGADNSNRTFPVGRHGEGLFAYLKDLTLRPEGIEIFNEIKENMKILDWFEDMQVPSGQLSMEFNLRLKDSYLSDTINMFDQRSTNEGFLYLLFYMTLIISDETPRFFAIENIDTAFNPKLCREVTRQLINLARKHDKQIIATTHNAAVLDGMNLFEDDVRLHVVRRNIDGFTKANRVILKGDMSMPLSEAWMKGFLGGLPDNF